MAKRQSTSPLIAGFMGGVVSTTLLLPLDVIKVQLQVDENNALGRSRRLGTLGVLKSIIKHEGLGGIYLGWTPAVIGSAVSWGGFFTFYEHSKRKLVDYKTGTKNSAQPASEVLTSIDNFFLACVAGGVMVLITNPVWLIKTRMQLQMKKSSEKLNIKPYRNMIDAVQTIVKDEGFLALYKGAGPALLLTSHGGVQFVVYEYLRKHFHYNRAKRTTDEGVDRNVWERFELSAGYLTMGAASKFVASTVTYPLQVIKSRMQQRSNTIELTSDGDVKPVKRDYSQNLVSATRKIWRHEGPAGFFKGVIPNAVRVAPGAAITFVVYESIMDWLGGQPS